MNREHRHDQRSRLTQTFQTRSGTIEAVRGIDFEVETQEIVGFLGPNGAGKTTTQRMLTTLLRRPRVRRSLPGTTC